MPSHPEISPRSSATRIGRNSTSTPKHTAEGQRLSEDSVMSTDDTEKPEKSVVRTVEHLHEGMARLRHDVSMMSAQLEVVRSHIQTKEDLIDDLRVLQADTKVAQARTEALEHRAERAEHLAQRIEANTIHRAELTDWRRAERRLKIVAAIGLAVVVALVLWTLKLHAQDDDRLKSQQQHTKQSLCLFMQAASRLAATPQSRALAAEAAKLSQDYGCHA